MTLVKTWGGRGEAKTKHSKLIDRPVHHKAKELATVWMHWNLKVSMLQVDGDHPVTSLNETENRLAGLHLEASLENKLVQMR